MPKEREGDRDRQRQKVLDFSLYKTQLIIRHTIIFRCSPPRHSGIGSSWHSLQKTHIFWGKKTCVLWYEKHNISKFSIPMLDWFRSPSGLLSVLPLENRGSGCSLSHKRQQNLFPGGHRKGFIRDNITLTSQGAGDKDLGPWTGVWLPCLEFPISAPTKACEGLSQKWSHL